MNEFILLFCTDGTLRISCGSGRSVIDLGNYGFDIGQSPVPGHNHLMHESLRKELHTFMKQHSGILNRLFGNWRLMLLLPEKASKEASAIRHIKDFGHFCTTGESRVFVYAGDPNGRTERDLLLGSEQAD